MIQPLLEKLLIQGAQVYLFFTLPHGYMASLLGRNLRPPLMTHASSLSELFGEGGNDKFVSGKLPRWAQTR